MILEPIVRSEKAVLAETSISIQWKNNIKIPAGYTITVFFPVDIIGGFKEGAVIVKNDGVVNDNVSLSLIDDTSIDYSVRFQEACSNGADYC